MLNPHGTGDPHDYCCFFSYLKTKSDFIIAFADIIAIIVTMKTASNNQSARVNRNQKGMSLVELLLAIGVLAIITAIVIPNFAFATDAADKSSARRNAQSLVTIANSASAAGLNLIDPSGDISKTIDIIVVGGVVSGGILDGTHFGLPSLSKDSRGDIVPFLSIEGDILVYNSN